MSETRKILVALDGSKHSEYALNCEYFTLVWFAFGKVSGREWLNAPSRVRIVHVCMYVK